MPVPTQPEGSIQDRIQRMLEQDGAAPADVSRQTSQAPDSGPQEEPEEPAEAEESDEDYEPSPNAQTEGDETPIETLADLAQRLEMDEEALAKHLKVKGRDGKDVPLADALAAFRAPPPDTAEMERARTRLADLEGKEAALQQAAQELMRQAHGLASRLKAAEPDWQQLRTADPARYASARLEWIEHERQLERAAQQLEHQQALQRADQQRATEEFRRAEARKLQAAVPEWKDTKVMQADLERVSDYLVKSWGLKSEEIDNLADSRDWQIARKAMLYDELQAQKPDLLKKVRTLPKVIAPGSSSGADRGAAAQRAKEESGLAAKFKQSGKVEDAAQLILRRMESSERRAAGRALATGRRS